MKRLLILLLTSVLSLVIVEAQTPSVNVTIDGPGVVDEYLTTSADGKKQVRLKAIPSKFLENVTFDGWSGDATGTNEELTVDADKAQNIHATFTYHRPMKQYPLLNLKQSWTDMGKPMFVNEPNCFEREEVGFVRGCSYLPVDYNRDGYMDYVEFPKKGGMGTDNHREKVRFWLGQADGTIIEDPKNDKKLDGCVYPIHLKYADLNGDGFPDFCCFSTGYDRAGSTGDYPVILMSNSNGEYSRLGYENWRDNGSWIAFHGGDVGDFDNDGDIDVLFWDQNNGSGERALYLQNDGSGNFEEKKGSAIIDLSNYYAACKVTSSIFLDCEIADLNNDGKNDLILCGNDHTEVLEGYACPPVVFWGSDSGTFGGDNYTILPPPRDGYGITYTSPVPYDLDGDGKKELLVAKCADGSHNTVTFIGGYLQVCQLGADGKYVDKTKDFIPDECEAFNKYLAEGRPFIENVEGVDYYCYGDTDNDYTPGLGVGTVKVYAIREGKLVPVAPTTSTKVTSFSEGLPIYVDGPNLTDYYSYYDGANPVDASPEHQWGDFGWDAVGGNMWRINMHHRENTHYGRTCIRWNRDGQDPTKSDEIQSITFAFMSEVDLQSLVDADYCIEFYIKNSDSDLTLELRFDNHDDDYTVDSFVSNLATVSRRHTDTGDYTGEWQRVVYPLSSFSRVGTFKFRSLTFTVKDGSLDNQFFLDDIRIRKIANAEFDDYERAFMMDYLDGSYMAKERTKQVSSQEFKAMLKPLIQQFAPDSMTYFNNYITDYDVPLSRGMATCMAYYVARSIGAESNNAFTGEFPEDIWNASSENYDQLLPHWQDPGEEDAPENMHWRSTDFGGLQTAFYWNFCHVSDYSGINVIDLDKETNSFHWDNPFTWEDAICAITRLYDSIDPEKMASGISIPLIYPTWSQDVYFNLNGQRVEHPAKGIYIKNGKKVIVR